MLYTIGVLFIIVRRLFEVHQRNYVCTYCCRQGSGHPGAPKEVVCMKVMCTRIEKGKYILIPTCHRGEVKNLI